MKEYTVADYLNDKPNLLRDINILACYLVCKKYTEVAEVTGLSKPRIREIVRTVCKFIERHISYGYEYDVSNDILTMNTYVHKDLYILIKEALRLGSKNKLYHGYLQQIPCRNSLTPFDYLNYVDEHCFNSELIEVSDTGVKSILENIYYYIDQDIEYNSKHMHDDVIDTLSEHEIEISESQAKYLKAFSVYSNSTILRVGTSERLINLSKRGSHDGGFRLSYELSIDYDGTYRYIVKSYPWRDRRPVNNFLLMCKNEYNNIEHL